MASYVVPQVEVHQIFSEAPAALAQTQMAFVFGPNYLLHRYGAAAEKDGTFLGAYTGTATSGVYLSASYPGVLDESAVDTSYTKLFGDNVCVSLGTFDSVTKVSGNADQLEITKDASSDPDIAELVVGRMLRINSTPARLVKILKVEDSSTAGKYKVTIDEDLDSALTVTKADLCEVQQGVEFPRNDFTDTNKSRKFWEEAADGSGIEVVSKLYAYCEDSDYDGKYGEVLSADLYLTYRELVVNYSGALSSVTQASEVAALLGTVSPDNPLAQAVYNAALNSGGQTVRFMAVPSNDLEGYSTVLNKATLTNEVYFLVPATRDSKVIDLVQGHVNSMSAATAKRWRIAFVSAEIPTEHAVYSSAASVSGEHFKSKVLVVGPDTADIQFGTGTSSSWTPSTETKFKKYVKVGDILYTKYGTVYGETNVPQKFKITRVLNDTTVRIEKADATFTKDAVETRSEIHHEYTPAEEAEVVASVSRNLGDRRVYNVFPNVFYSNGVQMTGEFAAACVAGLVSSCLPQQPVTNMEIVGIDDIPLVYQTFSLDELNTMAAGGTFIVMQDLPEDQVYVRHQISTAYDDNNLNTAELSITKNLDSISYYFDNLMSPYIGKYNITDELLSAIRNVVTAGLTALESSSYGLYGPQVIAEGTEIALLEQDAVLKDHINCNLQLNMPYPFNKLVLKLFV